MQSTFGPEIWARYWSKLSTIASSVPKKSRWSTSTFSRIVPNSGSSRWVPSLSSASTTSHSPSVHCAPVPMSVTSPPMMNDGRRPAPARISINIEVVVVLPCVPATPSDLAWAQIDDSIPARCQDGDARPRRFVELDVPCRNRGRRGHGVATGDVPAIVTDVHVDARSAHPLENRPIAEVAAADLVPHLGQDDRDRAHARPADADDVQSVRRREIERNCRRVDHGAAIRSIRSTRAPLR